MRVLVFMVLATHVSAHEAQGVATETPSIQEGKDGKADDSEGDTWKSALPVKIIEDPSQAERARDREETSDKHDADDLRAQQEAAKAAGRSATAADGQEDAAWGQVGVGITGIVALLFTIMQTRTAIRDNREIGQTTVRAYLTVKPVTFNQRKRYAEVRVLNTGQSPARNVRHISAVGYLKWPLNATQGDILSPDKNERVPTQSVGANSDITILCEWEDSKKETGKTLCVYGIIFYEDVFGFTYKLRFCAEHTTEKKTQIDGKQLTRETWIFSPFHNDEVAVDAARKRWWRC